MKFSKETTIEIWSDESGERVEVGSDRDSLELVELRDKDATGTVLNSMVFPPEQAKLIAEATLEYLETIKIAVDN